METKKLTKGNTFTNREIMDIFKCGMMGGIRKSNTTGAVLVIVDWQEEQYHDRWQRNDLIYQGKKFEYGAMNRYPNSALAEAAERNQPVHLFERYQPGRYTYRGLAVVNSSPFLEKYSEDGGSDVTPWFSLRPIRTDRNLETYRSIEQLELNFIDSPEQWHGFAVKRAKELGINYFDVPTHSEVSWPMIWESLWREYADSLISVFLEEVEKYGNDLGMDLVVPYYDDLVRGSVLTKFQLMASIATITASAVAIPANYPKAVENLPIIKRDVIEVIEMAKTVTQQKIGQILLEVRRQPSPNTPLSPKIGPAVNRRKKELEIDTRRGGN